MFQDKPVGYLYEVGIQGGIRRAADILGVNPSVISRQIAQLERALQLPLLERRGRNVVLTEAGRLLAEDYFASRQRREKLESQLKDLRHMRGGTISVRIGGGLITAFIEGVMREFAKSYPQVFVDIVVGSMQEMLNDIVSGEAIWRWHSARSVRQSSNATASSGGRFARSCRRNIQSPGAAVSPLKSWRITR